MSQPWDVFSDVVRSMQDADGPAASMDQALLGAVALIPHADHVSVTIVKRRKFHTVAATDDLVRRGDELQYELNEGPCLQAIREQETVQSGDLLMEERWPTWSRRVSEELGVRSMLSLQLFASADTVGALNIYSMALDAFDAQDLAAAAALAAHIAVALMSANEIDSLETAVVNRTLIGQAQGMLMQRYSMDSATAFKVLIRVSQHKNQRLAAVAHDLVTNGIEAATRQPDPH